MSWGDEVRAEQEVLALLERNRYDLNGWCVHYLPHERQVLGAGGEFEFFRLSDLAPEGVESCLLSRHMLMAVRSLTDLPLWEEAERVLLRINVVASTFDGETQKG